MADFFLLKLATISNFFKLMSFKEWVRRGGDLIAAVSSLGFLLIDHPWSDHDYKKKQNKKNIEINLRKCIMSGNSAHLFKFYCA